MKRFLASVLTAALAFSMTACAPSSSTATTASGDTSTADTAATASEDSYVLKFALQNGESHPLCQGVAKFGEILAEKTDGRITLELYYSGALGDKVTTVQGMQTGTIDGAMLMSGDIADYGCDDLRVFTLPYLFDSVEHAKPVKMAAPCWTPFSPPAARWSASAPIRNRPATISLLKKKFAPRKI